jgi:arylsulfatase A-like enzyme
MAAAMASCSDAPEEEQRPNIIFIMADDHANRTIGAYEGSIHQTPNIDRLAEEGAIFTRSYCSNSICGPSRASILTGMHGHRNGVTGNGAPWDNSQFVFPRALRESGYTTALIGKWHLNSLPGDEFGYSKVLTGAGKQGFYYNPDFCINAGDTITKRGFSTDIITNESIRWLRKNRRSGEPFMLFVQFKAPHVPRMPHFRYLNRYKDDAIPEPPTLFDDYATRKYAAKANMGVHYRPLPPLEEHDPSKNIYFDRMTPEELERYHSHKDPIAERYHRLIEEGKLEGKALKRFEYQQFIKDYLRVVDGIDDNVGRLLDWLDRHEKLKQNTVVVYASDQSYFTGEHGWAEKRFMYEEALQMPFLIRWPGHIEPGSRIDAMIQNIDYAPTFLDIAGVEVPEVVQGRSFRAILEGEVPEDWRESVYYHYYDHGRHNVPRHEGVRTNRYKLIWYYTDDHYEFFDLTKDPHELQNVYGQDTYSNQADSLKSELKRLRDKYQVPQHVFQEPYVPFSGIGTRN